MGSAGQDPAVWLAGLTEWQGCLLTFLAKHHQKDSLLEVKRLCTCGRVSTSMFCKQEFKVIYKHECINASSNAGRERQCKREETLIRGQLKQRYIGIKTKIFGFF